MSKYLCNEDIQHISVEEVKDFLQQGGHPDNNTKPGNDSPLCFACMYNRTEIARLLIEAGSDANFYGSYGRRPLMYAMKKNNTELGELLLSRGSDINALNEGKDNVLMDLASYSSKDINESTIKWLIEKEIDINYRNESLNVTMLQQAINFGSFEMAKILIEHGADGAKNGWHEESFMASLERSADDLAYYLLCNYKGIRVPGGYSALAKAISWKKNRIAKMMLEKASKSDIENWAKEKRFDQMLCDAAYNGNLEMCELLLKAGANVNGEGTFSTALQTASMYNHPEIVKLLLEHGAETDHKDFKGNTSLILAASEGNIEIVKMLLAHGADIQAKNNGGWTALMQAALFGRMETMKYLLEHGANANDKAESERNITVLMLACDSGKEESVKLLLEHGADPFAKDDVGLTAHKYAEFANPFKPEIIKLLPTLPVATEPELPPPKVELKDCPLCKGIKNYESRQVGGFGEDYRKYFFKVMTLLEEGPEVHEGYKYYTRTSYYKCPRCGSHYKKKESEDMDNFPTRYEIEVLRISDAQEK